MASLAHVVKIGEVAVKKGSRTHNASQRRECCNTVSTIPLSWRQVLKFTNTFDGGEAVIKSLFSISLFTICFYG